MSIDQNAVIFTVNETQISAKQVISVLDLMLKQDCTVPFITRYRKEVTGGLDEVQIRLIFDTYETYLETEKRRDFILTTIEKQEKLTPEVKKLILEAKTLNQLEDIYAPFKVKKKSKGLIAIEAGLLPFSELILTAKNDIQALAQEAAKYLNKEKGLDTFDKIVSGACDIIIEKFAHDGDLKEVLRKDYWQQATIKSSKRKNAETIKDWEKFKDYFEFEQKISDLREAKAGHRFLAMRRGMTLTVLKVEVVYPDEAVVGLIKSKYFEDDTKGVQQVLMSCAQKACKNYLNPSLELEMKTELKKLSDVSAIDVFGINIKNLLLRPYLGPKAVLGIDPGVRTGCKVAVVDNNGKYLVDTVIYPHQPRNAVKESAVIISAIIEQFNIEYIAIGNGTYGRETLSFIDQNVDAVKNDKVKATLVDESGASIYSTSDIARKEFPDKDPTVRGAISIARRFQDPLAELVKIDPKSIGVGQYQHDVNQTRLKKSLHSVVESCVNYVGVDLNTASAPLLSYISGIGPTLANGIVKYRDKNGSFSNRSELLKVPRFSDKVFLQAAGFLRIYNASEVLDSTFIHPEQYETIRKWCLNNKTSTGDLVNEKDSLITLKTDQSFCDLVGIYTRDDILKSLGAPSQDPRTEFKSTEFRKGINSIKDLKIGDWYTGIVTNITQFGAFVDIGIKENGLVHVSQMADRFVDNALEVFKVSQEVKVMVMDIDYNRGRISLTCKTGETVRPSGQQGKGTNMASNNMMAKKMTEDKKLKNNAFGALKNFKVRV